MRPGQIIRLLRQSKQWSQLELAGRLNVARTYLAQVESGRRSAGLALLREVSKEFSIPVALLFIDTEDHDSEVTQQLRRILIDVLKAQSKSESKSNTSVARPTRHQIDQAPSLPH